MSASALRNLYAEHGEDLRVVELPQVRQLADREVLVVREERREGAAVEAQLHEVPASGQVLAHRLEGPGEARRARLNNQNTLKRATTYVPNPVVDQPN